MPETYIEVGNICAVYSSRRKEVVMILAYDPNLKRCAAQQKTGNACKERYPLHT